jgi:hypothetical protein
MKKTQYLLCSICLLFFSSIQGVNAEINASISGKVTAEDTGLGVKDVVIGVTDINNKYKPYYAETDEKGNYILKDVAPGTYKIGFSINNSPYISVKPYLRIVLTKGKNVVNANHILSLGGSISGTVYDSDGITPLNEILVHAEVTNAQPEWFRNFDGGFTDSKGTFLLQGLPESDNCIVKVQVRNHAPLIKTVKITKGSITENVNFVLKWDDITGVSGTVRSSVDNKTIEGIRVILWDMSGNQFASAKTDETGKYSIVGVPPGTYKLTALWLRFFPKPDETINKENILVEQGKSTVVDFVFDKPSHL